MNWNKRFFLLLSVVTIFRVVYLFVVPLDLVADEAYYWNWSRQLDWGYFSKPPMVAWLIALFCRIIGSATAIVRLPAVLLGTISTLTLFFLARRMYDSRTAFWATVVGMASPGASALGLLMTIDAPLLCFWSIAMYMFWAGLEKGPRCSWEWFGLAAALGLGLLSKQVMGAFIVLMFLFAAVSRADRDFLKLPNLYLASFAGICALAPPILWNARHSWVTLHHTGSHFMRGPANPIVTFAEFLGGQIAIISPLTWILFAIVSTALLLHFSSKDRRILYLLCFSFVPLLGVFALSFKQRIEANWPAAVYPAGMILLAAWGCGNVSVSDGVDRLRPYFKKAVVVGVIMAFLTYAFPFCAGAVPGTGAKRLIARLQGWRQLGVEAGEALGAAPRPQTTFILTFSRQLASELAFYTPGQPEVFNWPSPGGFPENQYDLWEGPKNGLDALIIIPEQDSLDSVVVARHFETIQRLEEKSLNGGEHGRYSVYLGKSLKDWPSITAGGESDKKE